MTKNEVIELIARERRVETLVCNIVHSKMTAELKDLCQIIYCVLLQYDDELIMDLWKKKEINFFIASIVKRQYFSSNSLFFRQDIKFVRRSIDINTQLYRTENDE